MFSLFLSIASILISVICNIWYVMNSFTASFASAAQFGEAAVPR